MSVAAAICYGGIFLALWALGTVRATIALVGLLCAIAMAQSDIRTNWYLWLVPWFFLAFYLWDTVRFFRWWKAKDRAETENRTDQ